MIFEYTIFDKLFKTLVLDNSEELWLGIINDYLNEGGDLSIIHPKYGWSIIHYASENLFYEVINFLLKKNVNVDLQTKDGLTPYLIALEATIDSQIQNNSESIDFAIVKLLIDYGANVNLQSLSGLSKNHILNSYGYEIAKSYYDFFGSQRA